MSKINEVQVFKSRYPIATKVTWNDAVKKVNFDVDNNTFHLLKEENDVEAIWLVQCIGSMLYEFDDGSTRTINPGDALFIPSEVYHNPTVNTPRVTMSFGLPNGYKMES